MKSRKLLLLLPVVFFVASCSRDPKVQAQRYVENGNKFFEKGKFKEASIMYRRALQKDLRFGEAYYRLALTQINLTAYGDAVRSLRRAVELQPDNADAAVKLADIYVVAAAQDQGNRGEFLKDAKELADKLLARDAKSYDGHRLQGQIALLQNDAPGAVAQLRAASEIKPDQTDLAMAYVQALAVNKQVDEAEKLGLSVIDKHPKFAPMYDALYVFYMNTKKPSEAEGILKRKMENNPQQSNFRLQLAAFYLVTQKHAEFDKTIQGLNDEKVYPDGHLVAGDFYFYRTHDFDAARAQYEAGAKAFPKEKAIYQRRMVELLATTGKNAEANQLLAEILKNNAKDSDAIAMRAALMLTTGDAAQINQAVNDLQSLVAKTPGNHLLHFNLGRAYLAKNDTEQARLQLEAAIKIRPDFLVARDALTRIYLTKNDFGKALKEAEETIALNKNDLDARLARSIALMGLGDNLKAREELDRILQVAPNNADARYQSGFLAWQQKNYKVAQDSFAQLTKINPKDSRGLLGTVETMAAQNRLGEGIKLVEDAAAREPGRRDLTLALANLYVRDMRYDAALARYQELLKTEPKSADLLLRVAETQRRKGDINAAIDTFRRASQVAPTDCAAAAATGPAAGWHGPPRPGQAGLRTGFENIAGPTDRAQ